MKILGIDPSLNNLGMCLAGLNPFTSEIQPIELFLFQPNHADAESKRVVRRNSDDLRRAQELFDGLHSALNKTKPNIVAVELPVGSQSARAMCSYGIVTGVLASCKVPMIQVTAAEVKMAGCGIKTATKREMIDAAHAIHPDLNWPKQKGRIVDKAEHMADALFAIYAALKTDQFRQAMMFMKAAA